MKIIRLDVKGFRSLRDVTWAPGDLNVVIGPNGTGKSNLLRFLELASVCARGRLGKYVQNLGGVGPLVWDGRAKSIHFEIETSPPLEQVEPEMRSVSYYIEAERVGETNLYRIESELLCGNSDQVESPLNLLHRGRLALHVYDEHLDEVPVFNELVPENETLLSMASGPFVANQSITSFQQQLASWSVYHDLDVSREAVLRQPAVARMEERIDPDGQNLIPVLHTLYTGDREFKNEINLAMRAAFGDEFDELMFKPASNQRIELCVRWKSLHVDQAAPDLSDGTLRFLFLLAVLASPSPAPVIAIDEPETGLHPSMLPIIAEHAVDAAQRSQVILTTHSPQFLDAFGDTTPTTTVAAWENGQTILKTLNGEKLERWLKEYSMGNLFMSGELEDME